MTPRTLGALVRNPQKNTVRGRAWRAMRIHRRFSISDICTVIDDLERDHFKKWLARLVRHGIVRREGWVGRRGEAGSHLRYRLVKLAGEPLHPTVCPNCEGSLNGPCKGGEA